MGVNPYLASAQKKFDGGSLFVEWEGFLMTSTIV
jgi:hypothetical protein